MRDGGCLRDLPLPISSFVLSSPRLSAVLQRGWRSGEWERGWCARIQFRLVPGSGKRFIGFVTLWCWLSPWGRKEQKRGGVWGRAEMQFPCGCDVFNLLLTISHVLSDSSVEFWMRRKAVPAFTVFQGACSQSPQIKVQAVQGGNCTY